MEKRHGWYTLERFAVACTKSWIPTFAGMTSPSSCPPPIGVEGRLRRASSIFDSLGYTQTKIARGLMAVALVVWTSLASGASQRAHVHGVGQINIVVEGKQATVEFVAPAEGLYGFEHQARTPAEQAKRDAALARLQEKMSTMVIFEADRGCQFRTKNIAVVEDVEHKHEPAKGTEKGQKKSAKHSEVHAEFTVSCEKLLAGSQVRFGVSKVFPTIKTVHVQALSDAKQTGVEVRGDKGSLKL